MKVIKYIRLLFLFSDTQRRSVCQNNNHTRCENTCGVWTSHRVVPNTKSCSRLCIKLRTWCEQDRSRSAVRDIRRAMPRTVAFQCVQKIASMAPALHLTSVSVRLAMGAPTVISVSLHCLLTRVGRMITTGFVNFWILLLSG